MRVRTIAGGLPAVLLLGATTGCIQLDAAGPVALATHVDDWRDEVVYQLLVDRFADGEEGNDYGVHRDAPGKWHGGDWKGVEDHLDYLEELGVTALWISPVVKNVESDAGFDGYHGYWAQDLTEPNPHFGDLSALRSMVSTAHAKGMKVILDIVTNHMGQLFYYDMNENGQPDDAVAGSGTTSALVHVNEYDPDFDPRGIQARTSLGESGPSPIVFVYDPVSNHIPPLPELFQHPEVYNRRGRTYNFDDPDQLLHGDFPGGLKDVDTTRCDVKQALVDSYARWVELADLDGFRIDTVKHVEREFWRFFTQKVRQRLDRQGKKNFLMFGESFDGHDALCGSFTESEGAANAPDVHEDQCVEDGVALSGDQLDSVFYFPQYFAAIRDVFQLGLDTQRIKDLWALRPADYGDTPTNMGTGLSPQKTLVNFLDNHDVPRFLFSGQGTQALRNALLFLFTEQGIPCVYYGTEQEFSGGNDPANREDLWEAGFATDGETFRWIRKIAALRKKYSALRRGDQRVVFSTVHAGDEPDAGLFAFERTGGDAGAAYALAVFNTSPGHPSTASPMIVSVPPGTSLVDVMSDPQLTYAVGKAGEVAITVPSRSGALLVPLSQVPGN